MLDVWECDLVDVRDLSKLNDNYEYILSFIDAFSKFLHLVPRRSKTGTAVVHAFQSILKETKYSKFPSRPVFVVTYKGKGL